jgi:uncharacterized protein
MRETLFTWLIRLATTRRWLVLSSAVLLTLLFGGLSSRLIVDMRWFVLLPETLPEVREFKKIDANFYQPGNMIVAISGPDPVVLEQLTDEATAILQRDLVCDQSTPIEQCIEQERYARYVYGKLPADWLRDHALRLAKPNDARRLRDLLGDPRLLPYLTHLNDDFEAEYMDSENVKDQERQIVSSLDAVQEFIEAIRAAADGEVDEARVGRVVRDLTIGNPYMLSLDKTMSLLMVASGVSSDDAEHAPLIDRQIESLLEPLGAKYPDYKFERTGIIAVSRDELDSVGPVTTLITLGAMVIIFGLLVWNFRSVLIPIITLIPIVAGIVWTVGIVVLTIGSMNLFTVMIMVVLLGLGIDFSIHLATRFHEEIVAGRTVERALRATLTETGKGVITGAITTSAAFYTLMIADTRGIWEFGFCAGTGVLVTLLAVLWILPALLTYTVGRNHAALSPNKAHDFSALGRFAEQMGRWRFVVIPLLVAATAAGVWGGLNLQWEWNFNKLEPKGIRSVTLQDDIIEKYKLSMSLSLLTADSVNDSRRLRKELKAKPLVGEVDDISLWISRPDFAESHPFIVELREALAEPQGPRPLSETSVMTEARAIAEELAANRARLADELDRLWANLVEIQALSFIGGQDRVVAKTTQLVATRETRDTGLLRRLADRFLEADRLDAQPIDWASLDQFARLFHATLSAQAGQMAAGDAPVTEAMMPERIHAKYTSITGVDGYLMQIYPKQNLYEKEELELFRDVVTKVDPNVTGMPQMILNMSLATMREGRQASLAAMVVILGVLLLDFRRRPLVAGLAFLPLICGLALMLGVMWLFGEKLNFINTISLPVIIGIGVDDGVHFFHRLLQEGANGLGRAVTSVGRAMLMTSLTTMIGFGSLMFYLMEGMRSMGFALFVGVGLCFLVTITLLPALATLLQGRVLKDD